MTPTTKNKEQFTAGRALRIEAPSPYESPKRWRVYAGVKLLAHTENEGLAHLIAASPTLYEFVANLARSGNHSARATLDALHLTQTAWH